MRAVAATACALALLLAACQSSAPKTPSGTLAEARGLQTSLSESMQACWFSGDPAFASYIYSPEINAGTPRILIVPKNEPTALPLLVVETTSTTAATYYGPLLTLASGPRVRADLDRWIKGGRGCV